MRNAMTGTLQLNDPTGMKVKSLETISDAIWVYVPSCPCLILSPVYAAALATQLNEYLARFAAEKGLASVSEVEG